MNKINRFLCIGKIEENVIMDIKNLVNENAKI